MSYRGSWPPPEELARRRRARLALGALVCFSLLFAWSLARMLGWVA